MMKRALVAMLAVGVALTVLAGCGGTKSTTEDKSPAEVMTHAKKLLDEASSWQLSLSTTSLPKTGNAVLSADGVGTHAPAWKGEVKVLLGGLNATVPIVAVDGVVHAKLPLTPSYSKINPSEYDAPDPAEFMNPDTGISALLSQIGELSKEGESRDGGEVLTVYAGVIDGAKVAAIIPSAKVSADYETHVGINSDGQVSTVQVTGPFFSGAGDVTYDIKISDYNQDVKITAP